MSAGRVALLFQESTEAITTWAEGDCPLCASSRWKPWFEAEDRSSRLRYLIVRCSECDLSFTNPRPKSAVSGQIPANPQIQHANSALGMAPWGRRLPGRTNWRHELRPHGKGRLLDVGCGEGTFLLRMRDLGWNVLGLDDDSEAAQRLMAHGVPVLLGNLAKADLPAEQFDQITLWDTLGRSAQPLQTLRAAWRLLAPAGRIVVRTPNLESLGLDWFGAAWVGLDVPRQQIHFSPGTLRGSLLRAGFRNLRMHMLRRPIWLRRSAQQTGAFPLLRSQLMSQIVSWGSFLLRRGEVLLATARKA